MLQPPATAQPHSNAADAMPASPHDEPHPTYACPVPPPPPPHTHTPYGMAPHAHAPPHSQRVTTCAARPLMGSRAASNIASHQPTRTPLWLTWKHTQNGCVCSSAGRPYPPHDCLHGARCHAAHYGPSTSLPTTGLAWLSAWQAVAPVRAIQENLVA
jgi:hypothetical protein